MVFEIGKKIDGKTKKSADEEEFDEAVKAIGNPYSNTYNPGWRNHPNFSWRDQNSGNNGAPKKILQNPRPYQANQGPTTKPIEDIVAELVIGMKNLETQMGQISKSYNERPPGNFPSDTIVNPKDSKPENCSAINLRSGKTVQENERTSEKESELEKEKESKELESGKIMSEKEKIELESEKVVKEKEVRVSPPEITLDKAPFPKALIKKNLGMPKVAS